MPETKFPTPEVNLLAGDEFEDQTQGKFLRWALTWGKRIVVLTELVVILAFLSRFWLDTTVADLNDKIIQKKAIVSSSVESENRFRVLSARVDRATKIEDSVSVLGIYDQMQALIPQNVIISQLNVSTKQVSLGGLCDETTLAQLVTAFRGSKNFSDINIDKISKNTTDTGVEFTLKALYVK